MQYFKTFWDSLNVGTQTIRLNMFKHKGPSLHASKHLAMFAWALPPASSAGVHRPLSFLRYGAKLGWRIDAFHGETPSNQSQHGQELLALVPEQVKLHLVLTPNSEPSYSLTPQIDGGFKNALAAATQAIQTLTEDPPDMVLASGPPFYAFIAAYFVARHFRVPLALDYRDEWSECPFDFVSKGRNNRQWESRCLAAAAAVLFTTRSHQEHQLRSFPFLRRQVTHLIPNGWEAEDFEASGLSKRCASLPSNQLRIAHIGTLAGHTPLGPFLHALAQLLTTNIDARETIRVDFIGRRTPEADQALASFPFPGNIYLVDHVTKREANRRMQEADVLLLIAAPELERYLPGKLFEYIAARRPVLVFGAAGEASRLVEQLGLGCLALSDSSDSLLNSLNRLKVFDQTQVASKRMQWLLSHRRDVLAHQAFQLFETLIHG